MTAGSFNNQSLDIAVSDAVVRLRYGFREGCSFNTFRNLYLFQARERKFVVQPVLNLDHISWWIWNYLVGMRSSVRTLSSSVFTVCKILTFWLWSKVCLTVWNSHVRVRPNTKQVSTLFNQCKLYFEIQSSSRSLASTTVNGAVILVALVLYCFVLHLRKHVAATF